MWQWVAAWWQLGKLSKTLNATADAIEQIQQRGIVEQIACREAVDRRQAEYVEHFLTGHDAIVILIEERDSLATVRRREIDDRGADG